MRSLNPGIRESRFKGRCLTLMLAAGLAILSGFVSPVPAADTLPNKVDILIYGGTPGGIAAAVAAGSSGHTVLIVEPYRRIGGLMTNGLSHADFRTFEGLTGTYLNLTQRVQNYYSDKYGADSPQAECFRGTHAEPHVNQLVFEQMLSELPGIQVQTGWKLHRSTPATSELQRIESLSFQNSAGDVATVSARIFIDSSYEGDLLAAVGVPYHVGREGRDEFGESLAPETADSRVQGYNFRYIMTQNPENRVPATAPEGYRREDFLPLLDLFAGKRLKSVFCAPSGGIYKYQPPRLPNDKFDINDVSRGLVRLSLPQINDAWPEGDEGERNRLLAAHQLHQLGMLYFLQTDIAVPEAIRQEALSWGFCRDEFADTNHLPEQLYVREGRRMRGSYLFTEKDTDCAPGDARAVLRTDAIAMGDYGPNCHGTGHEGPRFGGQHNGEFYKQVAPYQIPYGVLTPQRCENLLVPVAASSSHVGFCALRLEPIWMSLGQAAGAAARMAIEHDCPVQKVDVPELQAALHRQQSATIYVSDVLPGDPDFLAVQWWGTLGGLHGLVESPPEPGTRGENLLGQYYAPFPEHEARLDEPLSDTAISAWGELAAQQGISVSEFVGKTRGDFIRFVFARRGKTE